jgi:hypothetical protein
MEIPLSLCPSCLEYCEVQKLKTCQHQACKACLDAWQKKCFENRTDATCFECREVYAVNPHKEPYNSHENWDNVIRAALRVRNSFRQANERSTH